MMGAAYGIMSAREIALRFMLKATLLIGCVSGVVLVVGLVAAVVGQPDHVYFPPLLIGGVVSVLCAVNYPILKRRHNEIELQNRSPRDS